jgi:SAM-dependent methyltransferase
MTNLLEYEFWKDKGAYYVNLFSGVLAKKERLKKREYFASQILKTSSRPIRWLDVGSGEGSKVFETIQSMKQVEPAVKIELVAVEPSTFVIAALREKLAQLDGVSLEAKNEKFSLEMLQPNTYDCVSFFHAAYYLASERNDFEELYKTAYASLGEGGLLLIQAVDEDADFQQLQKLGHSEHLEYSDWSQGKHTLALLKELWQTEQEEYPTHFDATEFLTQDEYSSELENKFLQLYSFVIHVGEAIPSGEQRRQFIEKMWELAKADGDKYYLSFNDIVISSTQTTLPQHRWIGISGTWRTTSKAVENDVRSAIREITSRGDGVITGGALGVDYFAVDEALKSYSDAAKLKVVIPAFFDSYIG